MLRTPSRRVVLRALCAATAAPALLLGRRAHAADTEIRSVDAGKLGTTVMLGLEHGPYPCPGFSHDDNSCLVFVPHGFRAPATGRIDTLVHFHGHGTNVRKTVDEKQMRQQFHQSRQNAIFVLPQGPVDANDGRFGKLETEGGFQRFLGEVRRAMQSPEVTEALGAAAIPAEARIGTTNLSAHSGGYRAAAACLGLGKWNVTEVYLFDALYAGREEFLKWVLERREHNGMHERHKLVAWYGVDKVKAQCRKLREELDVEGLAYRHVPDERKLDRKEMTRARVAFIRASSPHREVMHKTDGLSRCLEWSCFSRVPGA
jgi:hypothetical protein